MQFVPVPSVGCESYHHCSWSQKEWMFTAAGRLVLVLVMVRIGAGHLVWWRGWGASIA